MPDVFTADKKEPKIEVLPEVTTGVSPKAKILHTKAKHKIPGHSESKLSAYCYYPDGVKFVGADNDEKIVLLLRKHGITNVGWIVTSFLMVSAPVVIWGLGLLDFVPVSFLLVGIIFWYLLSFAFVLERFLSWFFNVNIVTDERVFDVDFLNLVYREITDANIDQIQDVTVRVGSVIRTVFDYGDVLIQTAAEVPEIEFEAVPHPDQVAQVLRELRVEEEREKLEGRVR